jgi:Cof subfamily protein (haloacid dehalogenase superfamily)
MGPMSAPESTRRTARPAAGAPRLVATDLDGTIVDKQDMISDRTVRALQAVTDLGVPVVFVTGRPPRWMASVAERTGHRGLAICANGALVWDLHSEQVVATYPMSVEIGLEVARRLRAALPEIGFAVEMPDGFSREAGYLPEHDIGKWTAVAAVEEIFTDPATKLLARHATLDADQLLAAAREAVGDLAELTHSSTSGLLEISAAGVSKATTLARLCADRGVDAADVLAFGDMPNDLPMLAWAGRAYAVAGAHPEVLAAVENVAPALEADGVAQVIEAVFGLDGSQ